MQRKKVVGDVDRYPTQSAAKQAVENLRAEINAKKDSSGSFSVTDLWGHFDANELRDPDVDRSPTTIDRYLNNYKRHIIPNWGETPITEVKAVAVERWLRSLRMPLRQRASCGTS